MDFLETIKFDSFFFEKVFCFVEEGFMLNDFRCLFNYFLFFVGVNNRDGEELIFLWWEETIDKETIFLSKILEFCIGVDEVLFLGFDRKIEIKFFN